MKLNELNVNMSANMSLLLTAVEERSTRRGGKYLMLSLSDGETMITANMWDSSRESFMAEPGAVLSVNLHTSDYNGSISYEVKSYSVTQEDPGAYVISAPLACEKMYQSIFDYASKLGVYSPLVCRMLEDNKEKLMTWSAAKTIHHNIRGGLLYHMYRMLQNAVMMSKVYTDLDKNLLYAGTILHDIGKMEELSCTTVGVTEYTTDGTLFGHLFLGAEMVGRYAEQMGLGEMETRLLKHMIVSHHGEIEYGAIAVPAIPEALVLHHLDCIDAGIYQFEDIRKNMEHDTMSDRVFGLGTRVYNP